MASEDESSWRLLFAIALSHGDAVREGRLTHDGWMVFLSSAQLIGTAAGVFPVLLDQLWQRQCLSKEEKLARGEGHEPAMAVAASSLSTSIDDRTPQTSVTSHGTLRSGQTSLAASRTTPPLPSPPHKDESVGFSGFVDMMKVICVRIFQTQRCSRLREEQGAGPGSLGETALVALRQSAEDHVLLAESVEFTAATYLRPFIARSVISASSQVRLHPDQNGWAPHVNRLLTHVVGALFHSAILPLFRRYAVGGRLTEEGYRGFLQAELPAMTPIEEMCALAIFSRGGFADVRPVIAALQPLADTAPDVAPLLAAPTLGLTDFIEALLMQAVVVYADEARYPELRPVTAKVWSFFENVVCRGAVRAAAMCADPYTTGCYRSVPPGLVAVYPAVVPLALCSCLFVEVFNARLQGVPSSASRPSSAPGAVGGPQATPFLTEVECTATPSELPAVPPRRSDGVADGPDVAVQAAATFFETNWSLLERNRDVPLFGGRCAVDEHVVLVAGTAVTVVPTRHASIFQVDLPSTLLLPALYRCAIEVAGDGDAAGARLLFIPYRSLPVELSVSDDAPLLHVSGANKRSSAAEPCAPWGCADVVVTDTAAEQLIQPALVVLLHDQFLSLVPAEDSDGPRITLADVCELCRRLQWCAVSTKQLQELPATCAQAWATYCGYQRLLHPSRAPSASAAAAGPSATLTFTDVLGCLTTLLFLSQGGRLGDVPDVPRRLELAFASVAAPAEPPAAELLATLTAAASDPGTGQVIRDIPYNALRDVPFLMALERKKKQSAETQQRRVALMTALRRHHAAQMPAAVTLPALPENRPKAMRLVSQYGAADPNADFCATMREGAEAVKAHFLLHELAIPEMTKK